MKLLTVIVNYRCAALTIDCLRSLAPSVGRQVGQWHVLVVEGGSGDASAQTLATAIQSEGWNDWASVLPLEKNGGFAYANNRGVEWAMQSGWNPEYVWLLNPDTLVRPGAAEALLEFMDSHPQVGIAGSRLEYPDGSPQQSPYRYPGIASQFENGVRLGIVSRLLRRWIVAPPPPKQAARGDWVSGASFMIRTRVMREIGLLDEGYFMYYEELDFCRRADRAGWSIWYVPRSRVVHLIGQSSGIRDNRRRVPGYWFDARRRYYLKFHGRFYAMLTDLAWSCGFAMWRVRRVIQRRPDTDPPRLLKDFLASMWRGPWQIQSAEPPLLATDVRPADQPDASPDILTRMGAVAIGRNEGERLGHCLQSLKDQGIATVYVDSGSTDGSVSLARRFGAEVVELDTSIPFTAARARNAGFKRLIAQYPKLEWVQFLDGDCELCPNWPTAGAKVLLERPEVAAVAGRLRERHPDASIYNRLCDLEWNVPTGEVNTFGGIVMLRVSAMRAGGGYNEQMIAGEDPELAVRLRLAGWRIIRLADDMAMHDAAMFRFGQWWKRNVRAGHACAQGAALHGRSSLRYNVRNRRSNWLWGLILPIVSIVLACVTWGLGLLLLLFYVVLYFRVAQGARRRGFSRQDAHLQARYIVLGKFPQMLGQLKYRIGRITGRRSGLIEHKAVTVSPAATQSSKSA